jgi:hypothetical protein
VLIGIAVCLALILLMWQLGLEQRQIQCSDSVHLHSYTPTEPVLRVFAQPVFAWLLPRQPLLLAFSYLVEVPRHECDNTKRDGNEEDENDYKKSSAAGRGSCVAGAECVMMVMMDFDSSVPAWVSWRVCIDYNSFVTLEVLVRKTGRGYRHLQPCYMNNSYTGCEGAARNLSDLARARAARVTQTPPTASRS